MTSLTRNGGFSTSSSMCFVDGADMAIDKVEGLIRSIKKLVHGHGKLLTATGGCVMLLYGGQFTNSVLFFQAFRTGGWSEIQKGVTELHNTYSKSRQALRKEMPTLMKSRELLPKLKQEAQESLQLLREANEEIKSAQKDQQKAAQQLKKAAAALAKFERKIANKEVPDMKEQKKQLEAAQVPIPICLSRCRSVRY